MRVKRKIDYLILWLFGGFMSLLMALAPWFRFNVANITYPALFLFFLIWDLPLSAMSVYLFSLALPIIDLDITSDSLIVIKNFLGLKIKHNYFDIEKIYYSRKLHRGRHRSFPVDIIYIENCGKKRITLLNSMTAANLDDIYAWLKDNSSAACTDERKLQTYS